MPRLVVEHVDRAPQPRAEPLAAEPGVTMPEIEVGPLVRSQARVAASLLADAFLDDPAWSAGRPRNRRHRRIANRASFRALLSVAHRYGGQVRRAGRGAAVEGVAVSFDPGEWPPPNRLEVFDLAWLLVVGPAPALRSYRDEAVMRAAHVERPHLYLWVLGVDPQVQWRGVGRALSEDVIRRAKAKRVPVYLETATEENGSMYERFGFQHLGEIDLPSGVRMWQLERPIDAGR